MKGLQVLNFDNYYKKFNEFYDLVKANARELVRKLKPKKFLYAFPRLGEPNKYQPMRGRKGVVP